MHLAQRNKIRAFNLTEMLVAIGCVILLALLVLPLFCHVNNDYRLMGCNNNLHQVALAFSIWAGDNNGHYPMERIGQPGGPRDPTPGQMLLVPPNPAFAPWAYTFEVFQVMSNELGSPKILICPADERKPGTNFNGAESRIGDFRENASVSFFYGRDADGIKTSMLLAGDRSIAASAATRKDYGVSGPAGSREGAVLALGTNFPRGAAYPAWSEKTHHKQGNVAFTDGSVAWLTSAKLRHAAEHTGDRSEPSGQGNALVFP